MQYLLHDLIKLPLNERLLIIEKMISSLNFTESEVGMQNFNTMNIRKVELVEKFSTFSN